MGNYFKMAIYSTYNKSTMIPYFQFVIVIFYIFLIHPTFAYPSQMGRVISTDFGRLRGSYKTFGQGSNLQPVEIYRGIQYATTLGSDLRFMPPTSPIHRWQGVQLADSFKPVCPQRIPDVDKLRAKMPHGRVEHLERIIPFLRQQTEDCLYLNIYVPASASNSSALLPVLMFVHAESYEVGTGNSYDGSVLASYSDVIVVTMNFRLGPFGFLTRGDGRAQGNYALLDIAAALHFIRHHIQAFGGDASRITLMGQGHGAALINLLLVSPLSKAYSGPLFARAILMSGSALSSWALSNDPMRLSEQLAEKVNCSGLWDTSLLLMECLNNRTYQDLLNADVSDPYTYTSAWGPVIDKRSVLKQDVRTLIEQGQSESAFADIDILTGVMKSEGLLFFTEDEITQGITQSRKQQKMRTYVRNVFTYQRQLIYDVIWHEYTQYDQKENPALIRDELIALLGDAQYVAPVLELADYHQHFASATYLYSFHYPSRMDSYPRWTGGVHGDDLTYVFGAPLVTSGEVSPFSASYTDTERMLSEAVMTYWTNFVKSGNPNTPGPDDRRSHTERRNRYLGTNWPVYELDRQQYLLIDRKIKPEVNHHLKGSKMALWLELIPKFHKSFDLEQRYHLLDNFNNGSTFDLQGVRPVNYKQMVIPPPLTPPIPPTTTAIYSSTKMMLPSKDEPKVDVRPTRRPKAEPPKARRTTPIPPSWNNNNDAANVDSAKITEEKNKLSFNVTLGVGCGLLFLNIIIFAAVYYQKDKIRQERKAHERAMNREQSEHMIHSDQEGGMMMIKSSSGEASDSDGASTYGTHGTHSPPLSMLGGGATMTSQDGVLRTRVSTLPLHQRSPIPVTPPMAPYSTLPHHTHGGGGGMNGGGGTMGGHGGYPPPPPPHQNHRGGNISSPHMNHLNHNGGNTAACNVRNSTSPPPPPPICNSVHYANSDGSANYNVNNGHNNHVTHQNNMAAKPETGALQQQQQHRQQGDNSYSMSSLGGPNDPHNNKTDMTNRRSLKRGTPVMESSPNDNHIQTPSTVV